MKQKFLLKTMLLLCALVVGLGNVWADVSTLTFTAACGGSGTADDGAEWTVTSDGSESSFDNTKGIHYGTGSAEVKYILLSTSDISGTITQVVVNASTASDVSATVSVTVDGDAFGGDAKSLTSSAANYTFTGSASGEIIVTVTKPEKAQKALYVKSIVVTYTSGGSTPTVATPSFNPTEGTYTTSKSVEIGCETDGATIHYTMTIDGSTPADPTESDATYSSAISVTKSGTKIKAKAFKADMTASSVASATYTIKPNAPTITGGTNVTITGDDGLTFYYTIDGSTPTNSSTEYTAPFTSGDCTVKAIAYDAYGNASSVATLKYKYMPLSPKNIGSGYYEKVTDVSSLENGDAILIVNETAEVALSTTQNTNNRGQEDIEFLSAGVIYAPSAGVQRLVLVKKTENISDVDTEVFYFYTGSGYLYAANSDKNYLKTEATPDDNNNARATISISSGDATITFKGTAARNLLRYNSGSSIFSCYSSGQTAVQIYKEVAHNESVTVTDAGYATYCSPYALDFTGKEIKVYIAEPNGTTGVTFTQINKVPANTGVLLYKDGGATEDIPVTSASTDYLGNNVFVPGTGAAVASVSGSVHNYILNNIGGNIGFYRANGQTVATNRAYIRIDESIWGSSVKEFIALPGFEDDVDGINSLTPALSEGEGAIYNVAGQRLSKMQKGINIVNGKKVLK